MGARDDVIGDQRTAALGPHHDARGRGRERDERGGAGAGPDTQRNANGAALSNRPPPTPTSSLRPPATRPAEQVETCRVRLPAAVGTIPSANKASSRCFMPVSRLFLG